MLKKLRALLMGIIVLSASIPSLATPASDSDVLLNFIMEAKHGKMVQTGVDQYRLTIPKGDVHSVLAFSSRPHRLSISMTPQEFWGKVSMGSNSFKKDPPNLILTWGERYHAATYVLTHYQHNKASISLDLKALKHSGQKTSAVQTGRVSLYIDSVTANQCGQYYYAAACSAAGFTPQYGLDGRYSSCSCACV